MTLRKPQRSPQRMPLWVGQGKPQRMGTPYYPSLSLLPLPCGLWSPSSVSNQGAAAPAPATTSDAMMEEITSDGHIHCAGVGCIRPTHDADFIVAFSWPHGHTYRGARCKTWWLRDAPVYCLVSGCDAAGEDRDSVCRIVEVLR